MEMFLLNAEVARLEGANDHFHPRTALALAWHLRERNAARALALASRWDAPGAMPTGIDPRIPARSRLIRAEAKLLLADYGAARSLAVSSQALFDEARDECGSFDAHWILAQVSRECGRIDEGIVLLEEALALARSAGDVLRAEVAGAARFFFEAPDERRAVQRRGSRIGYDVNVLAPLAWEQAALATIALDKRDFAQAVEYAATAHDAAVRTGQLRQAMCCAELVGRAFAELSDHRAGLEWMSESLALARICAGPARIFPALTNVLEAMQPLAMRDDARRLTEEALRMENLVGETEAGLRLRHIRGEQALQRRDYPAALEYFTQLQSRADSRDAPHWRIESRCGRATALARLSRPGDAMEAAQGALNLAQQYDNPQRQISATRLIAELQERHRLFESVGVGAPGAGLPYLLRARDLAQAVGDYSSLFQLQGAIAREYAKSGDHAHAYGLSLLQIRAGKKCEAEAARKRSAAVRARRAIELLRLPREREGVPGRTQRSVQGELFAIGMAGEVGEDTEFVRFVAGASHQLRQPVHAVSLYLETFNGFPLPESAQGALAGMRQCFRALQHIFLSLLDLACLRAEAMSPVRESFPIMELLSELANEFASEAKPKAIDLRVVPCSCWVQSDKSMLRKMLQALAATALQHPDTARISIGCRRKGGRLRVSVYAAADVDTDLHADAHAVPGVEFSPTAFDGLAGRDDVPTLHLALARRLGALLLAPVSLALLPNGGSVATFDLPLAPARAAPRRLTASSSTEFRDKLVVVIEDDELVRGAMQTALARRGCDVVAAASCREAIDLLCEGDSVPDALVCDFRLADGATGLDAIRALRTEFNADIPALVITSEPSTPVLQEAVRENIPVLPKPVQFTQLWESLGDILQF